MALPTNFKDDVLDASVNELRKYNMINNPDGSVSFEDITVYTRVGSSFGMQQINETNGKVNELENSFSQALTDLKATAIARAVGATGNTFASVIQRLAAIINRGALNKSMVPGETYNVAAGYYSGGTVSVAAETGTFSATTNGTHDMGATNSNRYVNVSVTPHLLGTYSAPTNVDVSNLPYANFLAVLTASDSCNVSYYVEKMDAHPENSGGNFTPPSLTRSGNTLIVTPAVLAGYGAGHNASKYMATSVYYIS